MQDRYRNAGEPLRRVVTDDNRKKNRYPRSLFLPSFLPCPKTTNETNERTSKRTVSFAIQMIGLPRTGRLGTCVCVCVCVCNPALRQVRRYRGKFSSCRRHGLLCWVWTDSFAHRCAWTWAMCRTWKDAEVVGCGEIQRIRPSNEISTIL